MRYKKFSLCLYIVSLLLIILTFSGCGNERSPEASISESSNPNESMGSDTADAENQELTDGTYDCEVENTTRSNGPYTLDCDKSGSELVIHFTNGGYITNDIDSANSDANGLWTFETTNPETADNWSVEINHQN